MSDHRGDARKIVRPDTGETCPVGRSPDGTWQVRGYAQARAVLRSDATVQAGLGVETVDKLPARVRRPVLYRDGPEHREDRRRTARFFTPRRVDERYRGLMARVADRQLERLRAAGEAQLSELSFGMAIEVAGAVIGLTSSRPGIRLRLESFFPEKFGRPGLTSPSGIYWLVRQNVNWLRVYLADVRPAIRDHRRHPRDDLISHLIAQGCTDAEILGECLTFAAAGMVTTREFICVAAWHLFTDGELLERYRAAGEPGRLAILHEILRLEPAVARLRRRTTAALDLPGAGGPVTVPPGALVEVLVEAANADPSAVGADPLTVCPGRAIDGGATSAAALSFGDGPHRCPGAGIAILETDVLLSRLFALEGVRMAAAPRVSFVNDIGGYEIRGLRVSVS
ncbi:cytochrome P450 [Nonomuraea rhodomycinica]|uniref:Cytochrome P450 n=1 Tax=Nonomuraea rhodomycinica TaxID=1712872 RepID=A0A7Y6IMR1_9ACTN|nr:cytochrome P450 [Nonomuraea rhodomycinica]NUW40660.1 cytochrome P450 [Nonomuraea rhodomycinica]